MCPLNSGGRIQVDNGGVSGRHHREYRDTRYRGYREFTHLAILNYLSEELNKSLIVVRGYKFGDKINLQENVT